MKIEIQDEGKKYLFIIPNCLLFSPLIIRALKYAPGMKSIDFKGLTPKKMRKIRRCIRKMKKIHKSWYLVEVEGENSVKIKM